MTTSPAPAPSTCSCPEGRSVMGQITRRAVLGGAGALGLAASFGQVFGPEAASRYAYADGGYSGDTIVVLSLRGGFDGLSAVAPVADASYVKARPTIGLPASRALQLDTTFGMHPALGPLKGLWDRGILAVVHAVGQSAPTRSHFAAMELMEKAAPGSSLRSGWIDRMIGLSPADTFSAVCAGSTSAPIAMSGPNPELTMRSIDSLTLNGTSTVADLPRWSAALAGLQDGAPVSVTNPVNATLKALASVTAVRSGGFGPANGATYPDTDLGRALKDVATLVKAGVGLRAATVDVGDWDMHSGLGRVDDGWMFRKLVELGQALGAFTTDLGAKMDDVTLVTLSEFGRRVAENGSGGLDHGNGNLSFVIGGGVAGGKVYGRWPGLSATALADGDLASTTDYRTLLAEMLEKRGKLPTTDVFPGLDSARLGLFKQRA